MATIECIVLGIAQDGGLPHLGCQRPCCKDARRNGRTETPACLALHDADTGQVALIEATPAITAQVDLLHTLTPDRAGGSPPIDALVLTHLHMGHCAGLVQLGREAAATHRLPVHLSALAADALRTNMPWRQLVADDHVELQPFDPGGTFEPMEGVTIQALPVPHRDEWADTMALRITTAARTALFCPDIDAWDEHLQALLDGIDVALLDGTFHDATELGSADERDVPHPLMSDTIDRIEALAGPRPADIRFIHCNHTNAALHDLEVAQALARRGFPLAATGDRVPL